MVRRSPVHAVLRIALVAVLVVAFAPTSADAQFFTVSGTVTDQFLAPVPNVNVVLFDQNGTPIGIPPTVTDMAGFYSIAGLPTGSYIVGFEPQAATKLLPKEIGVVVTGNTTLNATLDPGHLLSGFVRDSTGVAIFNIDLKIEDRDSGEILNTPGDNTDSTGFYNVVVPTGRFDISYRAVDPQSLPWITVEIRDVFIDADTTIDVTMIIGVFVSGTVVNSSMIPVFGVNMDFTDSATGVKLDTPGDNTDSTGFFQVHVPIATYDVAAKPRVADRLVGVEILSVPINGDTTLSFVVEPGLMISGVVRDPLNQGVAGVDIDVNDASTGERLFTPFDNTDLSGNYAFIVPAGVYDLDYQPPTLTLLAPVRVPDVPVAQDTTVNVTVPNGILLSGTVTDNAAQPVQGVDIDAEFTSTGVDVPLVGDQTDIIGQFTVVVAPGVYTLDFEPPKPLRLVAERLVGLGVAQDTTLSIALDPGVSISGVVKDSLGALFPGVEAEAVTTVGGTGIFTPGNRTNAAGHYEIIVPADSYSLIYRPDPLSGVVDTVILQNVVAVNDTIINVHFMTGTATGIGDDPAFVPRGVFIESAVPNPFNPETRVTFVVPREGRVRVGVYDVRGARVAALSDGVVPAGRHTLRWNGVDDRGASVASGVYFILVRAGGTQAVRKVILLK